MSPDIHVMREEVRKLYPLSKKWKRKVKNMPDAQVIAIYMKHFNKESK
jgi:ribosomal silencing factor RsfS